MSVPPSPSAALPLAGVRVLDFGLLLPGPVCALHLAWLGADVLKVEPPGGDPGRALYDGAFFDTYNRGKRSIAVDLKSEAGRAQAQTLARDADVLIENFRPGVADRLGIGASALRTLNPRLIYCSINGYGSGARGHAPAHDLNFLARSGAIGQATTWSAQGRRPMRPSLPIADLGGAAMGVQSILAALYARERSGEGARIEIAMNDVLMHWLAWRTSAEERGAESAWTRHLEPANDIYATADGRYLTIGAIETHLWRNLVTLLDEVSPGWFAHDTRTWDWKRRRENAEALSAALSAVFMQRPIAAWLEICARADVPVEPVQTPAEAFADPFLVESGLVREDGWVRPPLPSAATLAASPALDMDGDAVRGGRSWLGFGE